MNDDLTQLANWADPILEKISAPERRLLAKQLARDLRRSQQQRIKTQQNPDGSQYTPRKSQQKKGHIKRRAMFVKMRQNRYLKTRLDAGGLSVGFFGRIARIARVHQGGLYDETTPGGPKVKYEQRILLGFTQADIDMIMDTVISHVDV